MIHASRFSAILLALALMGLPSFSQNSTSALAPIGSLSSLQAAQSEGKLLDALVLGNAASETAHRLLGQNSDTTQGLLGESARRLLPLEPVSWQGGSFEFTLKVDPVQPNYFTIKLSGDDVNDNRLLLFIDGKQVGYKHLGDIDQLDFGSTEPAYNGRFFYTTTPLPLDLTRGKTEVKFEIRSIGQIWGYGATFDKYQKNLTTPTRGIYRVYTHTGGYFNPPANEKQGMAPKMVPLRQAPGIEVMDQLKARVNRDVDSFLRDTRPLNQMQMQLLAKAYRVKWTSAYQNPKTIARILSSLDALYLAYIKNPDLAVADPVTWNPDWFGLGVSGQIIDLLREQLKPTLNDMIDDGKGGSIKRGSAYGEMLFATREYHRTHRRLYTNQTMINDLYGVYFPNRGLQVVDAARAFSEPDVMRYLYESVGLQPWRDSDPGATSGPAETGGKSWGVGANYWQLTDKGLTRELGYVGTYGEVLDWVNDIYNATRPSPDAEGDPKIKAQLLKIAKARAAFRYPSLDAEGNRVMRLEQVVGWRDSHYPGEIVYGQRQTRDASSLQTAYNTLDPEQVGYVQQMMADNQFFETVAHQMTEGGLRVTIGLIETPDQYEKLKAMPPTGRRLPMSWDQPNSVFTDEQDGVLGLKNGNEILFVSLYWRARNAINNLARVHYVTPAFDRVAVVRQETQFTPSGQLYTRPDWTNFGFGNGGPKYPVELHSAHAGEKLPIAKVPSDVNFKPGDESVYAGKGDFYTLRYGPYLIGMNMTTDKTFSLKAPNAKSIKELVSSQAVKSGATLVVKPRSTVVLYLG